jgi:hypothetical protein
MSERAGPGRVLMLVYGFFALAAGARSGVQLALHASRAPLAYTLSALAALTYLAATLLIRRAQREPTAARWAARLCLLELAGVVTVGTLSLLDPHAFPDATVWSQYGLGYGFVPAILPLAALRWLKDVKSGA